MIAAWLDGLKPPSNEAAETVATRLRQTTAAFTLLLLACTWRLWTPQDVYPRIPFFEELIGLPEWVEIAAAIALAAGFLLACAPAKRSRIWKGGLALALIGGSLLILLDQHRLQPWAWLALLIAVSLLFMSADRSIVWLRVLVIGVYLHSGLSKLDYSFLHTHGPELIDALLAPFDLTLEKLNGTAKAFITMLLPAGELLIAFGLWTRRFRRPAIWLSILMHVLLLLALGPWGLNHKPAVLVWNVQFIVQNVLLFGRARTADESSDVIAGERSSAIRRVGYAVGIFVIATATLLPFLEPFGWFDHWPAWALYVSRPERVTASVHVLSREKLPPEVREQTDPPRRLWCRVHLDRWSLEAVDAPIYPQGRYRIAVALALAEEAELGDAIRIVVETPAGRFTGQRLRREIRGIKALRKEAARYTLNTKPRD